MWVISSIMAGLAGGLLGTGIVLTILEPSRDSFAILLIGVVASVLFLFLFLP